MISRVYCAALVLPSLLVLFHPSPSLAWGCQGHQIAALIAQNHLTPETRKLAEGLLRENPIDPEARASCGARELGLLAAASTWADDIRRERPETAPWHYINIPRAAEQASLEKYCGSRGCITEAIASEWAILKDAGAPRRRRAEALRFLIHFVADLHMPLHASDNNDLGGNCVPLQYFGRTPVEGARFFSPNLHEVWDTSILQTDLGDSGVRQYAQSLDAGFRENGAERQKAGDGIEDWAWESHELANSIVYSGLTPPVPVEKPLPVRSCSDAIIVIKDRLARAGLRLAALLNEALEPRPVP
jgi:hypothetical protein